MDGRIERNKEQQAVSLDRFPHMQAMFFCELLLFMVLKKDVVGWHSARGGQGGVRLELMKIRL
jgi:hypothetical protein